MEIKKIKKENLIRVIWIAIFLCCWADAKAYSKDKIIISIDEFPPYFTKEFKDNGFLAKSITEIFSSQGIDVEFRYLPIKRAVRNAKEGRIDGIAGSFEKAEFEKDFIFSESLIVNTISFFYLISSEFEWSNYEDLKGFKVGATLGYDYGKEFHNAEAKRIIEVEKSTKNIQNFNKLLRNRIQLFPMSTLPGYVLLYKNFDSIEINRITNHSKPVYFTHIFLMLNKNDNKNSKYLTLFNRTLKEFKKSGKFNQYFDEYLDFFRNEYVIK